MTAMEKRRSSSVRLQASNVHRRLVEYFVVISSFAQKQTKPVPAEYNDDHKLTKLTLAKISKVLKFQASVTSRYPTKDHEKNPLLHESIISFCHPCEDIELTTDYCLPKVSLQEKLRRFFQLDLT